MKRSLALLVILCMVLCFAACNKDAANSSLSGDVSQNENSSSQASTPSETEKPEHTHSFSEATCKEPATCTCGETEGEALAHSYNDATCTEPKTCKDCGETEGEALGHSLSGATCTTPKTCKTCGVTEGAALGHSFSGATCTTPKTCKVCGVTEGAALGHSFNAATCTTPKTCKVCGVTEGAALGHSFNAATCTTPKTCKVCGVTEGAALGHSFNAATCTTPKTCKVCGLTEGTALGHNYNEKSCIKTGTCTLCGIVREAKDAHNYVAGECTVCNEYNPSYCPKLYFTGDMTGMTSKADVRNISVEYRSKDQVFTATAKIKLQGTSSLAYDKKNYTINFYEDDSYTDKKKVDVGWGKQNKYCLKANWIDKTHARNVVTAQLAGEMQKKYGLLNNAPNNGAIDGFPVEIYMNGEFYGLYTMNIPKDDWMFNMDDENPDHIVICGESWTPPVVFTDIPKDFSSWAVEVGSETPETLAKIQRLVSFVAFSTDEEFKAHFSEYLDLDSTLNYYIMMHYAWLPDNAGKNMLLATYDGKVWYPTLYDLDTSWGADWQGKTLYDYKNTEFKTPVNSRLWERIEKLYKKELVDRYFELRASVLDTNHVKEKFNGFYNNIPKEIIDRETAKWGSENAIPGFPISQIEEYLNIVIPRLDAKFNAWKQ